MTLAKGEATPGRTQFEVHPKSSVPEHSFRSALILFRETEPILFFPKFGEKQVPTWASTLKLFAAVIHSAV